ncbi:MAG: hypothetical protein ACE5HI_02035 [bacterium]
MDDFKIIAGKKYGWDGEEYESEAAAQENAAKYRQDGFDTRLIQEEGKYYIYTRRVVTEIKIEVEPV